MNTMTNHNFRGYEVTETNNIADSSVQHEDIDHSVTLQLGDPDLKRITRLRLLTDRGLPFFDISYCYGETKDGRQVRVDLGIYTLPRHNTKARLIEVAREAKVNAKALGLLNHEEVWSCLY
jgi:hypothetical protein